MMDRIELALCQTDIAWGQPARNLERIEALVARTSARVVVLPEMFATGFDVRPEVAAEREEGPVLEAMQRWAARYDKAVTGSVAVADGGTYRNRMYFVKPSGDVVRYDKRHVFRIGGEGGYTSGRERVVAEFEGWRFLLAVCYDLRFPVWLRERGDYDAVLCCASWPAARREAWRTLLRARAIENMCYVAGVNRAGSDPAASYAGDSAAIDFRGRTLAEADAGERVLGAVFDREALRSFREGFPAWRDADAFELRPEEK